ncbi:Nuclear pore complex protein NUP35 [Picochlorum sp. SENEW3]|nr:Nuclear pore complex protein NUP35 [Picochlorum sp. SENEW3]
MSFQTTNSPQGNGNQNLETFSLLFSPPADPLGQQMQSSPLARSASKMTPGSSVQKNVFRDYTPKSRRRSMTPSSRSIGKETPPPPPTTSLFDTTGEVVPKALDVDKDGAVDMNISPGHVEEQGMWSRKARTTPLPRHPSVQDYESCWVTVYGFHKNELPLVLREFSKCGDIVDFGHFNDGPYVNWTHICYDTKYAAQRALLRSGQQLSPTCMVGVKELDQGKVKDIEQQRRDNNGREEGTASRYSSNKVEIPTLSVKKTEEERKKMVAAQKIVPLESTSAWEKVCEFVLGI